MDSKLCLKVTWWPGAPRPCSLLLARCHNRFPASPSSALPPCWQQRRVIYFLSPDFHPKANLLANEFQCLCRQGRDKRRGAGRIFFFSCIWEEDFQDEAWGRQGGGRGRWREKQPRAVPSAGSQLGFQQAALGNGTQSWLWF